ncbi:MAG: gamma-glutamylcyclotransferase, partial [Gaiellales bacterium]
MLVLVIGSALRSRGVDQEALGLRFLRETATAPRYRLFSLEDRWAALVEDPERGVSIAGELVEVDDERWPGIVASEPPGITSGPIELADGTVATAALGDLDH